MNRPHVSLLGHGNQLRHVRVGMWCVSFAIGAAYIWINRRNMISIDGISYLEIGEACLRGDWSQLVNGHWSPLYGLLLAAALRLFHLSPEYEIYVVQLVNVLLYAGMLTAFDFLLRQIIEAKGCRDDDDAARAASPLPAWGIIALGYALVAWFAI